MDSEYVICETPKLGATVRPMDLLGWGDGFIFVCLFATVKPVGHARLRSGFYLCMFICLLELYLPAAFKVM